MASQQTLLTELGWRPFFSAQMTADEMEQCRPVRVMAVHRGMIAVTGAELETFIAPRIPGADAAEDRPAVGDWLLLDRDSREPIRLLQRASLFRRLAAGGRHRVQVIAANVDTLFIVASCNQDFNLARLERYLVMAREAAVKPVLVLTKVDLTERPETFAEQARSLQADLLVEPVNARQAGSVAQLAAWCGPGQTVALVGSSGVGKSTLVNTLRGSSEVATQSVRAEDGKGRHTTTVRAMHRLAGGGWLLDTPGMRELQLADVATGIAEVFDDIGALAQQCRFSNCSHGQEPGCAIQAALEQGTLDPARLARWRKLLAEETAQGQTYKSGKRPRR